MSMSGDVKSVQFDLLTIGQLYFLKYELCSRHKHRYICLIILTFNVTRIIGRYLYIFSNFCKNFMWDIVGFTRTIFNFFTYIPNKN